MTDERRLRSVRPVLFGDLRGQVDRPVPLGVGHPGYLALLDELRELHRVKSGGYGTAADPFANYHGVAAVNGRRPYEYPVDRAVEKLTRCVSLLAQGRDAELREEFLDVASLMLCAEALRADDHPPPGDSAA